MDARINQVGKSIDFQTFSQNIQNVIVLHFRSAIGRIALRMVPCPNLCSGPLNMLCEVSITIECLPIGDYFQMMLCSHCMQS